jgi:hypothetical protein
MPSTAHGLFYGQPSAFLAFLLMGGWYSLQRGRPWLAGVLLGIATFKPHVVVIPLFWILLERRWRTLLSAGLTALALSAFVMVRHGPIQSFVDWIHAMGRYDQGHSNVLGSPRIWGLPSA